MTSVNLVDTYKLTHDCLVKSRSFCSPKMGSKTYLFSRVYKMHIALFCEDPFRINTLADIAHRWGFTHDRDAPFALILTKSSLKLRMLDDLKLGTVYVDFIGGAMGYRRKFGGGKRQFISKAVGLNKGITPTVLDATAGLGRDAFVLASLGCKVQMVERHPVVAALLEDGLHRAQADPDIGGWVRERMSMMHASSEEACTLSVNASSLERPSVVYLDPMFPHKKKSALVKKEMHMLQSLVGADNDADKLFVPAYALATKRVVVKRPKYAQFIAGKVPSLQIESKNTRFDVYVKACT